jgi:hypothetical protein
MIYIDGFVRGGRLAGVWRLGSQKCTIQEQFFGKSTISVLSGLGFKHNFLLKQQVELWNAACLLKPVHFSGGEP